jgi:hypothetical protein
VTSNDGKEAPTQGPPFFPSTEAPVTAAKSLPEAPASLGERVQAVIGLDRDYLAAATPDQLAQVLEELLGALKNAPQDQLQLGERYEDGSLRITSHLAVWLVARISDAYGCKLVSLSKIHDPKSLRSISGLAKLLAKSIKNDLVGAGL